MGAREDISNMTLKQKVKTVLSIWAGVSSFAILLMLIFHDIPEAQLSMTNTLCSSYITGSILLVYSYYFGDSDAVNPDTP